MTCIVFSVSNFRYFFLVFIAVVYCMSLFKVTVSKRGES